MIELADYFRGDEDHSWKVVYKGETIKVFYDMWRAASYTEGFNDALKLD